MICTPISFLPQLYRKRDKFLFPFYGLINQKLQKLNDFPIIFCQNGLTKCLNFIMSLNQVDNRSVE